jgi:hypothetical protein
VIDVIRMRVCGPTARRSTATSAPTRAGECRRGVAHHLPLSTETIHHNSRCNGHNSCRMKGGSRCGVAGFRTHGCIDSPFRRHHSGESIALNSVPALSMTEMHHHSSSYLAVFFRSTITGDLLFFELLIVDEASDRTRQRSTTSRRTSATLSHTSHSLVSCILNFRTSAQCAA